MGGFLMGVVVGVTVAVTLYLIGNMIRGIQNEKRQSGIRRTWKNFGLSIAFCILFLVTWAAHGVAQWQTFTDEQRAHGQPVEVGDFTSDFLQSTLENWQSEFLQLFSFVVMSALLIHKGSAESKDSDDRMEEALKRIEDKLGTK
ncbi:MAG TPA: DUF6766 family protein [Actinomycetota bacterium]|nr:DUF6766 family protein [Actinomycetota bacterium]